VTGAHPDRDVARKHSCALRLIRGEDVMAGAEVKHFYDRRSGIERRQFTYTFHIPERRIEKRRVIKDRRRARRD